MTLYRNCLDHENRRVANDQCGSEAAIKVEVCNTQKCPMFRYDEWSECSKTCGTGIKRRTGTCFYKGNAQSSSLCPGNSEEIMKCNTDMCPRWWRWSGWSSCSHSCGKGSQSRSRKCVKNRRYVSNDECLGEPTEKQACNSHACPAWSEWSNWTKWSQSCGQMWRYKSRDCHYKNMKSSRCNGSKTKTERTFIECPDWNAWSSWTPCSKSCGSGLQSKNRTCYQKGVTVESAACYGDASLSKDCNVHHCPVWLNWSLWTGWSQSCGNMTRTQTRTCLYKNNYVDDTYCSGPSINSAKRFIKCPFWNNWESWNPCSVSCGTGQKLRSRKCLFQNSKVEAFLCKGGSDKESEECSEEACPIWSDFSPWSNWSAQWGDVKRSKSRTCQNDVRTFNSNKCVGNDIYSETKTITPPKWSNWMAWSKCSKACGTQSIERNRFCFFNGRKITASKDTCDGDSHEKKKCESKPCMTNASWGSWNSWTHCSTTCGIGEKYKYRDCLIDKVPVAKSYCRYGETFRVGSCANSACPDLTEWSEWSESIQTCGNIIKMSTRKCVSEGRELTPSECGIENNDLQYIEEYYRKCPEWSNWANTPCSVTCGRGIRTKIRKCEGGSNQSCNGPEALTEMCHEEKCPIFSSWESWSDCSAKCGGGKKYRQRLCRNRPQNNQLQCTNGFEHQEIPCATAECREFWTRWTKWSRCSATCGAEAVKKRRRKCFWKGQKSFNCIGEPIDTKSCGLKECIFNPENMGLQSDLCTKCFVDGFTFESGYEYRFWYKSRISIMI